jgi:hypothetical protein
LTEGLSRQVKKSVKDKKKHLETKTSLDNYLLALLNEVFAQNLFLTKTEIEAQAVTGLNMTSWFQPRISKVLIASLNQTRSESWPRQSQEISGLKAGLDFGQMR